MKAKEFIPASKPRNFVAKNQKTGGAGAHRDKKKEQKQGYEKHKNKDVSEGINPDELYGYVYDTKNRYLGQWNGQRLVIDPAVWQKWKDENGQDWASGMVGMARDRIARGVWKVQQEKQGVAEGISVVDQDYDLDQVILTLDIEGKRASFTYTDYDENFENAERKDVFDQLQNNSWYKGLDHPTKMEILDAAYKAIRGEEPSEYKPRVGDEPMDDGDLLDDLVGERVRDPEDWDEGNTEPPNNFAIYINGKKWKVFQGRGRYADDEREMKQFYDLKAWCQRKSDATGKKWEVSRTGEPATA